VHSSVHGCDSKGQPLHPCPRLKRATKARRYLSLVPACCFRRSAETTRRIAIMTKILGVPFATSNSLNKQIFITRYNEKDTIILRSHDIKINSVFYSLMFVCSPLKLSYIRPIISFLFVKKFVSFSLDKRRKFTINVTSAMKKISFCINKLSIL